MSERASQDPATQPADHWVRARSAWLAGQVSDHTRRTYRTALDQLIDYAQRPPNQWTGADLIAWIQELRELGRSPATCNLKLAAVSSFFTFCQRHYLIAGSDGRPAPLAEHNPALAPERTSIPPYNRATHLDPDQIRRLLGAPDRSTAIGARDFAILLAYVYTGRRSSEIRRLRWDDIRVQPDRVFYTWTGKGRTGRTDELPAPVYRAIVAYHQLAGRTLATDDFVFVATVGRSDRPLSIQTVNQIVKRTAAAAGLDPTRIHTHTLRHSAAMLRRQLTDDLQEIQSFLNHASIATTQVYLQRLDRRTDDRWSEIETLLSDQEINK